MSTVAIVDYGMGNLDSVARAVDECGGRPVVTSDPERLREAAAVILPGVGAFSAGMENLRARGLDEALAVDVVGRDVPLLGLCLGMQLLASRSEEGDEIAGLGFIEGDVRRLEPAMGLRVPHVGWNDVHVREDSRLFADVTSGSDFYFVHSYHLVADAKSDVVATTHYGTDLVAGIERGSVFGVQFHPEKSQRIGFTLLRTFLDIAHATAPAVTYVAPRRS